MKPSAPLVALLALLSLLLAGCGGPNGETTTTTDGTTTCPDGFVPSLHDAPHGSGTHDHGAPAADPCEGHRPTPPAVLLGARNYTVQVYGALDVTWTADAGSHADGHSMLMVVRLSHHSVPDSELAGLDSYGLPDREVGRAEHQDLPGAFGATSPAGTFTPDLVGTRYLRVYAQIRHADNMNDTEYWSEEVPVNVTAVQPTGVVHTITHGLGGPQGGLTPATVTAVLGDAVSFANEDVLPHTFTNTQKPACAAPIPEITVQGSVPSASAPSPPLVLLCPGPYVFESDDVDPLSVTINAA